MDTAESSATKHGEQGGKSLEYTVYVSAADDGFEWVGRINNAFEPLRDDRKRWLIISSMDFIGGNAGPIIGTNEAFNTATESISAAVIVYSTNYLDSFLNRIEFLELVRRERQENLLVFRIMASQPSTPPKNRLFYDAPLSEAAPPVQERVLTSLATNIATRVQNLSPGQSSLLENSPSQPQQSLDQTDESGSTNEFHTELGTHSLSATLHEVVKRASQYAGGGSVAVTLNSDLLLLAMAETRGTALRQDPVIEWLHGELGESGLKIIRDQLFSWYHIDPRAMESRTASPSMAVADLFNRARGIARRTNSTETIHTRHALAALLTEPRLASGAHEILVFAGKDVAALRRGLFEILYRSGDDDQEWSLILLGRVYRTYRMAGFHADDTRGEDLLGIEQDVLAFATLIAARSVTPPLSIGLFGEWGSGKSFFMRHLQSAVAGLARDAARSGQMQRDQPFYKRIVQIEFNAWHYVEGNLWASLVEHIFRNLHVPGEKPSASEALQKRLIDDLKFTEQAREEAHAERRRALREVVSARKRVSAARREHECQREALAKLAAKRVADDLTREEVSAAVGPVLECLGIPAVKASVHEMLAALSEARALIESGRGVFLPLVRAPEGERRRRTGLLLMVLFLGPLVGWLVGVVMDAIGDATMAQLTAFASGAATLLTAGATWVKSQVKWGSDRLAEVEKAQAEVDRRLAEKQSEHTRELRALQEKLQLARADYEAARRKQADAETRVKNAKAKLDEQSVAKLLASFIEDRAQSADYRKHLGVLALVRNDFETLSDLIEEENWRLSPPGHDDDGYPGRERFVTLEDEEKHQESRINRIVLYIDDLDRCPPNKVVEVLQAVHLLLAFPLFVVVVGVDARWVKRSLEVRYRELLHGDAAGAPASSAELLIGKATTDDYLEKIFQVPFWLRRMDDTDTAGMVRGLLGSSLAPDKPQAQSTESGAEPERMPPTAASQTGSTAGVGDRATAPRVIVPGGLPGPGRPVSVGGLSIRPEPKPAEKPDEPQVNLESLVFRKDEVEFMEALAPLLDRSPRALKRFVNVYRLIKAGLTPAELRGFHEAAEGQVPPYQAVLFLLAVDTGLQEIVDDFFALLRNVWPKARGSAAATLFSLVENQIPADGPFTTAGRGWMRIHAWLRRDRDKGSRFDPGPAVLAEWEPRVTRFSFRAQA